MAACTSDRHGRVLPACDPPKNLIKAMVAAGVKGDGVEGDGQYYVLVDGVESDAWRLFRDWACSTGEAKPLVHAFFGPKPEIFQSKSMPPMEIGIPIQIEANRIVNVIASMCIADLPAVGTPVLPGPSHPLLSVNVRHAEVAVSALIGAISNPGVNYPVISSLRHGSYICHVFYRW